MRWCHKISMIHETLEIDAFIAEVVEVCKKHGFSIAHEDNHGAFLIQRFSQDNVEWLQAANDDTEVE